MKKSFIVLFLLLSINLFCADFSLSAGGGGLLGYTFTRYTMEARGEKFTQSMDRFDYAGFVFFDATYGEFSVLLQGGNNNFEETQPDGASSYTSTKGKGSEMNLGFSLMGKYPFTINKQFLWFPLLGVEYQIALIQRRHPDGFINYDRSKGHHPVDLDKDDKPYPLSVWNSFWIDVGAGLDYQVFGPLYLRSELIFGFRIMTGYETGSLERIKNLTGDSNPKLMGLTGGPSLKIGFGYRF